MPKAPDEEFSRILNSIPKFIKSTSHIYSRCHFVTSSLLLCISCFRIFSLVDTYFTCQFSSTLYCDPYVDIILFNFGVKYS